MVKKSVLSAKDLKNVEDLIKSKHTVLLLHASWCIHCQMFSPQWDVLLHRFSKRKDVQFLSMESEVIKKLNETNPKLLAYLAQTPSSPDLYFPKIMVFLKGEKSVRRLEYTGDRSADAVQEFLDSKLKTKKSA